VRQDGGGLTTIHISVEGETVNELTTIGLDLAKNVFHYVGVDRQGREVRKQQSKRKQLLSHFANLPPSLVGMEACAGAHHWGRQLRALAHEVRLLPPQHA
jgi:transposase